MNDAYPENVVLEARELYDIYCAAVGGKAFNGDPLPSWDEFQADPKKLKQVQAWCEAGSHAARKQRVLQVALGYAGSALEAMLVAARMSYDFKTDASRLTVQSEAALHHARAKATVPTVFATGTLVNEVAVVTDIRFPTVKVELPQDATSSPQAELVVKVNEPEVHPRVAQDKQFRRELDDILQRLKLHSERKYTLVALPGDPLRFHSRHRDLAIEHIEDAIMRLGMDLKEFSEKNPDKGTAYPYPESYNPASPVISPTADGVKL